MTKIKHGFWSSKKSWEKLKFYHIYWWMKARCNSKTHIWYKNYWWRWIKCEWETFEKFRDDMYESYLEHCNKYWRRNTTLDRIDNNWNYCKENCKWSTRREQWYNTRRTNLITIDNQTISSIYLIELCWIDIHTARERMTKYKKWLITKEDLFRIWPYKNTKRKYPKEVEVDWVRYTSTTLSKECWVSVPTARQRIIRYSMWRCSKEALLYNGTKSYKT